MIENQRAEIMETNTPREFFEKALPARFKPEKAAGINVIAQLNITGSRRRKLDGHFKRSEN